MKNAQNGPFCAIFLKPEACGDTRKVTFNRTKIDGKCQTSNFKSQILHFEEFSNHVVGIWIIHFLKQLVTHNRREEDRLFTIEVIKNTGNYVETDRSV